MSKIVTLGEIMLRLSTENNNRIIQSKSFKVNYGGGEANVAIALSNFGVNVEYVTKLPENSISESIIRFLKSNGVNTQNIVFGGERVGTYYLEIGNGVRPSKVIYDRKNSSFTTLIFEDLNIENILEDCKILHLSGITPALSKNCKELMEKIIKKAKEKNILISFDFNYRSKLWSLEEASNIIKNYLPYIDICFAGILDCKYILKMESKNGLGEYYKELIERYPNIKYVFSTQREVHSVNENTLQGYIYKNGKLISSKKYRFNIVDRVGGGDAFAAGALFGIYNKFSEEKTIEFAIASSVYKHTINGDANLATKEEIENFMENEISTVLR